MNHFFKYQVQTSIGTPAGKHLHMEQFLYHRRHSDTHTLYKNNAKEKLVITTDHT